MPWIHIPLGFARTYVNPKVNWKFETQPQPQLNNRQLYLPRGKTLGGSSSINGMVYIRGNHGDYDEWRQRGCEGWDWDSVLPYFRKAENQARGEDEFHGVGGPLHVSDQPSKFELAEAALAACEQAGIPRNPDFNGAPAGGVRILPDDNEPAAALEHGESLSGAGAGPGQPGGAHRRACDQSADRERSRHRRGISHRSRAGAPRRARREVVVSGGAYGSPQLLQLSGIGPGQHLQELGIPVVKDMPSVGSNLHDHFNTNLAWRCAKAITLNDLENSWPKKISAAVRYALFRSGPMASNGIHAGLFTRSDPRLERPDLQINIFEWSTLERSAVRVKPHPFPGFTLMPVHLRPEGRGTVRLKSRRSAGASRRAVRLPAHGVRHSGAAGGHPAVPDDRRAAGAETLRDGRNPAGHDDGVGRRAWSRTSARAGVSNQHPTSSCAMGHGPNTVVDPRLRVHGIEGLRVADASIMPVVVGGNTNAPTIMIGEKCAAMMLEDAA